MSHQASVIHVLKMVDPPKRACTETRNQKSQWPVVVQKLTILSLTPRWLQVWTSYRQCVESLASKWIADTLWVAMNEDVWCTTRDWHIGQLLAVGLTRTLTSKLLWLLQDLYNIICLLTIARISMTSMLTQATDIDFSFVVTHTSACSPACSCATPFWESGGV